MKEHGTSKPVPSAAIMAAIVGMIMVALIGAGWRIMSTLWRADADQLEEGWRQQIADVKAGKSTTVRWPDPVFLKGFVRDQPGVAAKIDTVIFSPEGTVADERFGWLRQFPNLRTIGFYDTCGGVDVFLSRMAGKDSITCLGFARAGVSDLGVAAIASFPNLNELGLVNAGLITNPGWAPIARMTKLQRLTLSGKEITDQVLPYVAGLTQLDYLSLEEAQVTNTGISHLAGLTKLHSLILDDTLITDAGLAKIAGLTQLHRLSLSSTKITDAGLAKVASLAQLHSLWLDHTNITDIGLASVARLPQVRKLGLAKTGITDAGLATLAKMSQLEYLCLDETQVTDAGISRLTVIPTLRTLSIAGTNTSGVALDRLQRAMPNCKIISR